MPADPRQRFDVETKEKIPATLAWARAFMVEASPHLGALAMFMYFTGCRPGEAVAVQWGDVDCRRRPC